MEHAKLKAYKVTQDGTELKIFVPNRNLQNEIIDGRVRTCEIRLEDNRKISYEQRKKAYACIADISKYTGYQPEQAKELMKYLYIIRTGGEYFSLSNCSMETAKEFINVLLDYIIENGIQMDESGVERSEDIDHYLWKCLRERKCCVCGRKADLHHSQAIGRGFNRKHFDDSNLMKMALCRNHHTESHTIGQKEFMKKYKVYGIKYKEDVE